MTIDMKKFTEKFYDKFEDYKLVKELKKEGILEEIENYYKTGIPRCPICKQNYEEKSQYHWVSTCECIPNVGLMIGGKK